MQKKYIAGGIIIETDIEFPELISTEGATDVVLAYGKVPEELPNVKNEKAKNLALKAFQDLKK